MGASGRGSEVSGVPLVRLAGVRGLQQQAAESRKIEIPKSARNGSVVLEGAHKRRPEVTSSRYSAVSARNDDFRPLVSLRREHAATQRSQVSRRREHLARRQSLPQRACGAVGEDPVLTRRARTERGVPQRAARE